jgi:hypothetical protein
MKKLDILKIGIDGTDYYFSENPQLIEFLNDLYPRFKFQSTLSLTNFSQQNNHSLDITTPTASNLTYDCLAVQDAMVNSLLDYLDKIHEEMHRHSIKSATVHLSRISLSSNTDSLSLKTKLTANLRACFVPD